MKTKNILISASIVLGLSFGMLSCKSQADKDKEIKAKIEAAAPGVTVEVKDGVATLTGNANDENSKKSIEETVKKVDGVKSISNQLTVPPPPVINNDQELVNSMNALNKDFPKVQFSVANGEVTLNGEISKADLQKLIQKVQESKPKKVNNNLVVK